MPTVSDLPGGFFVPTVTFATRSLAGGVTANAGELSGAPLMIMNNSGANPGSYTMRTAAQMITDSSLTVGALWYVLLVNGQATGTLTLATAAGITLSGTLTVAAITARLFVFQVNTPTTILGAGQLFSFTATALAFGA